MTNIGFIIAVSLLGSMCLVGIVLMLYFITIPAIRERLQFRRVQRQRLLDGLPPLPPPISVPRTDRSNSLYPLYGSIGLAIG